MAVVDLFRPKWKHSKWTVRVEAVGKISDHRLLAQIARKDTHPLVRRTAVNELSDQQVLVEIAKADGDADVSLSALRRLKAQQLLADVVEVTQHERVAWVAVAMLNDQELLARLARTSTTPAARMTATRKLMAQATLAEIASTDTDAAARRVAVELLTDQELLSKIARADREGAVRKAAVEKLADHGVLTGIARDDSDKSVRIAAAKRLAQEGVALYEGGTEGSRRLLAWLLDRRGRHVRWTHSAPMSLTKGEWTIAAPEVPDEGAYNFWIPREYSVVHLEAGVKHEERHTVRVPLGFPPATFSTFLVDGQKVLLRLHWWQSDYTDEFVSPVNNERESNYVEEWCLELLD